MNKRKNELSKNQRKKINFINGLKYSEPKVFSVGVDVYKYYEGDEFVKIFEVLSTLKNEKLKINIILFVKYKNTSENSDFEQDYWSRTAEGVYKIGHDNIRLMKWICYYDRSFSGNIKYYDLMGSICKHLNEISER